MEHAYLTPPQAAEMLHMKLRTFYQFAGRMGIPYAKLGYSPKAKRLYRVEDIQSAVEKCTVQPTGEAALVEQIEQEVL